MKAGRVTARAPMTDSKCIWNLRAVNFSAQLEWTGAPYLAGNTQLTRMQSTSMWMIDWHLCLCGTICEYEQLVKRTALAGQVRLSKIEKKIIFSADDLIGQQRAALLGTRVERAGVL